MKLGASKKIWMIAAAVLLSAACAVACAQSYSLGDEADEIATIQTALKQLNLYSGDITGHYGSKTQEAVQKFQKRYALNADGIAGEEIPTEARIIAVADAYDAMSSRRSYRDVLPQAKVREEVEKGKGTQFDPVFAEIMLSMIDEDRDYQMREK